MTCLTCDQYLPQELTYQQLISFKPITFDLICHQCMSQLISSPRVVCPGCGRADSKSDLCRECLRWEKQVPRWMISHQAMIHYNHYVREWFYRYKYQGDLRLTTVMKEIISTYAESLMKATWVVLPSSPQNLKRRHFHPVEELLKTAGIPFETPFQYIGDGKQQANKTKRERIKLQQPFKVLEDYSLENCRQIIIFDDVYTTGATMMRAKEALVKFIFSQGLNHQKIQIKSVSLARASF